MGGAGPLARPRLWSRSRFSIGRVVKGLVAVAQSEAMVLRLAALGYRVFLDAGGRRFGARERTITRLETMKDPSS